MVDHTFKTLSIKISSNSGIIYCIDINYPGMSLNFPFEQITNWVNSFNSFDDSGINICLLGDMARFIYLGINAQLKSLDITLQRVTVILYNNIGSLQACYPNNGRYGIVIKTNDNIYRNIKTGECIGRYDDIIGVVTHSVNDKDIVPTQEFIDKVKEFLFTNYSNIRLPDNFQEIVQDRAISIEEDV